MDNYRVLSEAMCSTDDDVVGFFDGEYEWVDGWHDGIGRGISTYDVFTDGRRHLLRAEHFGFDDTYYRYFFVECT
jgi:hypothetical protein